MSGLEFEPVRLGEILDEWKAAKQREQDALQAWHDHNTPELLTAWANAAIDLLDLPEQLELELGLTEECTSSDGPYSQSPAPQSSRRS